MLDKNRQLVLKYSWNVLERHPKVDKTRMAGFEPSTPCGGCASCQLFHENGETVASFFFFLAQIFFVMGLLLRPHLCFRAGMRQNRQVFQCNDAGALAIVWDADAIAGFCMRVMLWARHL